jgi:hypothetical protein
MKNYEKVAMRELLDAADLIATSGNGLNAVYFQGLASNPIENEETIKSQLAIETGCDSHPRNKPLIRRLENAIDAIQKAKAQS